MIWVSLLVTWVLARLCNDLIADLPPPSPPPDPEPEQAERRAEIDGDNVFYF
jgi:hypothetical protein